MFELNVEELFWRDHQPWLLSRGYQLRARYQPDWIPSWVKDSVSDYMEIWLREDRMRRREAAPLMDAVRIVDNKPVIMKRICSPERSLTSELAIAQYVSSPELLKDPDNHCLPIIEVLEIPDTQDFVLLVMPLLLPFDDTRFDTIGECLDFFYQIFKGIQFLHHHHIAHRDCTAPNVMMDPSEIYPGGFHPVDREKNREYTGWAVQKYTRTQRPPKYYWIDFGLSVRFDPTDKCPRASSLRGTDKSPPEFRDFEQLRQMRDPFPTDIYYLGNLIRHHFTEGNPDLHGAVLGLDFMTPLVQEMVQEDMSKRPTIDQCVILLEDVIRSQSSWTLRSQVWHKHDTIFGFFYRFIPHWARRIMYIINQTPAVPSLNL